MNDHSIRRAHGPDVDRMREQIAVESLSEVLSKLSEGQIAPFVALLAQQQLQQLSTVADRMEVETLATVPSNGRMAVLMWYRLWYSLADRGRFEAWKCVGARLAHSAFLPEEISAHRDAAEESLRAACGVPATSAAGTPASALDVRLRQFALESLGVLDREQPFARDARITMPSPITGRRQVFLWRCTRAVFPRLLLDGFMWRCVSSARAPRGPAQPIDMIRSACDAIEWLLTLSGHRHVGRVEVLPGEPEDGLVWSNRAKGEAPPSDSVRFDAPELELRVAVHTNGDVDLIAGGSLSPEVDSRLAVMRRLVRSMDEAGWALQRIDARGVWVSRVRS